MKTQITKKVLLIAGLLLLGIVSAMAQTVAIQGVIRDANARAVDDGQYKLTFKIYKQDIGGTEIWSEIHESVRVKNAVFNVEIGSVTPLNLPFDTTYYVGVSVATFEELKPRIMMSNYPYAMAVNGAKNKFPSAGNVVIGDGGALVFADNTVLSSANGGSVNIVTDNVDPTIIADLDGNGSGKIQMKIGVDTVMTIGSDATIMNIDVDANGTGELLLKAGADTVMTIGSDATMMNIDVDANGTGEFLLKAGANTVMTVQNDGTLSVKKIIDKDDPTFYLDPAGTSKVNTLTALNIGIVDDDPTEATLVVRGFGSSFNFGGYGYLNSNGQVGAANATTSYSIYASRRIAAAEFNAFSDRRIKDVVGLSNGNEDLDLLNKIKVTNYHFIDRVAKGNEIQKKVIAQELEEIYPEAVSTNIGFIPNVYELSKKVSFDAKKSLLTISTNKKHTFKKGDKVELILEKERTSFKVEKVLDENTFVVQHTQKENSVFVFGKEVNDFRNVDYDAISMLNVSATQQLAKEVAALKTKNALQLSQLSKLSETVAKLEAILLKNTNNKEEGNTQNSDKK